MKNGWKKLAKIQNHMLKQQVHPWSYSLTNWSVFAEDEFKKIASLLVGSYYVSSTNLSFDKLKLISDYNNDIIDRLGELHENKRLC